MIRPDLPAAPEPDDMSTQASALLALAIGWYNTTPAERKRLEPTLSGEPIRCTQAVYDEALEHGDRDDRSTLRTMHSHRLIIITPHP